MAWLRVQHTTIGTPIPLNGTGLIRRCVPAPLNIPCEFSAGFRAGDTRMGAKVFPRRVTPMADATLPTTRVTLLTQLRQDPSDQVGWDEFVERYGRHIYRWCRQWK